jgi:hypothetical protein
VFHHVPLRHRQSFIQNPQVRVAACSKLADVQLIFAASADRNGRVAKAIKNVIKRSR